MFMLDVIFKPSFLTSLAYMNNMNCQQEELEEPYYYDLSQKRWYTGKVDAVTGELI